jgi:putative hemolysin
MFNKHGKIEVRIGKPVDPKLLIDFGNKEQITRYLRAKTYALGSGKFHDPGSLKAKFGSTRRVRDIIDPTPLADLLGEIRSNKKNLLITHGEYQVYCCEAIQIPAILREISRLREICFREVGEGTNRPFDLDEFDFYYRHLFVWSTGDQQLVGAYRLGAGDELMSAFGKKGFYLSQLFHIKDEFAPVLKNALELGRAFIAKQYQRRPLPLVLLWKGIYQFALRDEGRFRYLIGPVSISNSFSKLSKELLVDYIRKNYFDETYAKYIRPRKRFKYAFDEYTDTLSREHAASIQSLDGLIEEIEHYKLRIPVLIKKYLQLNARIIAFNLDPKFNNSLDGFLMINIDHIPEKAFDLIHRK